MEPYSYVGNNPIMFTDPTGMSKQGGGDSEGGGWISRAWTEVKSWFNGKPKTTISVGPIEDGELQTGTSWYDNGVTSTVINSTTVVNQPNVGDPSYSFIYPNNLGSWGERGSDGKTWIGCMSCHGDNGAYREAAYNSKEALAGNLAAYTLSLAIGGALGSNTATKEGIAPNGWITKVSDKGGGIKYIDPKNSHNQIRQMPGNPKSSFPAQQKPYIKYMKAGKFYDVNGNPLSNGNLPEAHIPVKQFNINNMPKF